jgi:hypothetical protein
MNAPRLADLSTDGWELRSGEEVHRKSPETFWLPDATKRRTLEPGVQVKLMFAILEPDPLHPDRPASARVAEGDDGFVERMWVDVTEVVSEGCYLGALRNQPFTLDPDDESVYLRWGAEVPFTAEHVIDINAEAEAATPEGESGFTRRWAC